MDLKVVLIAIALMPLLCFLSMASSAATPTIDYIHPEDGFYGDQPHQRNMLQEGRRTPLWMDVQALLSFKKHINDPSGKLSNWTTGNWEEACSWYGIACTHQNPRVVAIILPGLNLTGEIPAGIGSLGWMRLLNLSWNQLEGQIPPLGSISTLEQLDLAKNNLFGGIPEELSELHMLASVNFSFNNLCGSIPEGTQFSTFNVTSFQGNKCLCGSPLLSCKENKCLCGSPLPSSKENRTKSVECVDRKNNVKVGWLHYIDEKMSLISLGIGAIIGFGGVVIVFIVWKKARDWMVPPNVPKRFYGEYRLPT